VKSTCAKKGPSFILAIIGILVFVAGSQAQSQRALQPRIIGGQEAYEGKFPHQVSIQLKQNSAHFCGSSLIKDNDQQSWVLTAAH
jgi:secreted trypsin-like serine protease